MNYIGNTLSFVSLSQIRNPNKIKTTSSLIMNIYTASNDLIAGFSTGVTLDSTLLTSGSSNIVSISPSVSTVQTSSVTYNMIFNPGI